MQIIVKTDGGKVVDVFGDVCGTDMDSKMFGPAITAWLVKTLAVGGRMEQREKQDRDQAQATSTG